MHLNFKHKTDCRCRNATMLILPKIDSSDYEESACWHFEFCLVTLFIIIMRSREYGLRFSHFCTAGSPHPAHIRGTFITRRLIYRQQWKVYPGIATVYPWQRWSSLRNSHVLLSELEPSAPLRARVCVHPPSKRVRFLAIRNKQFKQPSDLEATFYQPR